jgi:hypothetical protein
MYGSLPREDEFVPGKVPFRENGLTANIDPEYRRSGYVANRASPDRASTLRRSLLGRRKKVRDTQPYQMRGM